LVRAGKADDAMARALIAKQNPVIEEVRAQDRASSFASGEQEGFARGQQQGLARGQAHALAEAILDVLQVRGVVPALAERARILGEQDPDRLRLWLQRAVTCTTVAELLTDA
jgi:hypothetical protein